MNRRTTFILVVLILLLPLPALAWSIPGHMLSGSIAYQILRAENPATIQTVKMILEKHPWYGIQWKEQFEALPESQRDEMLFMLAPRWADDIRTKDQAQHRRPWHYINLPFKPAGQPAIVQTKTPEAVNILTALAENERIGKTDRDPVRKAVALAWLFHLVGDIHQPLHTVQLFTTDYPYGDRGGNFVCIRPSERSRAIDLHRFWDGLLISSSKITQVRNTATLLRYRPEFSKSQLGELSSTDYESWAKESFEIAAKFTYQNGAIPGTSRGKAKECRTISNVKVLPSGYARAASHTADRRIMLAGFRLAGLLTRLRKD